MVRQQAVRRAGLGRVACVLAAAAVAQGSFATVVHAQPEPTEPGDIEIDPKAEPTPDPPKPDQPTTPVKDPKLAKKVFAAGQQAAQKGEAFVKRNKPDEAKAQFEIALAALLKATELGDDVNVYFHLAGVEDRLGKHVDAVKHYRVVTRATAGVTPAIAKAATAKLDEVMGKIGTVALVISPDGTAITLGGEQVGVSPLTEPLVLLPGTHTLTMTASGFQPKEVEVRVEAGSESERKIELDSIPIVIEKPRKVQPGEAEPIVARKGPSLLPVYISGGVSLVLIGTAIATGLAAKGQHDTFVAAGTSPTDRNDAREVGKDYAHLTDVCLTGALVAAGFGAYWYIFQYRPALKQHGVPGNDEAPASREDPKVTVVPWVQSDTNGFAVVGKF